MASGAEVSEENWLDRPVLRKRARSQNPSVRPWGKEDRTVFENCTCGQAVPATGAFWRSGHCLSGVLIVCVLEASV